MVFADRFFILSKTITLTILLKYDNLVLKDNDFNLYNARSCFYEKIAALVFLFFLPVIFFGCPKPTQDESSINNASASETKTRTSEQVLTDFKALEPQDIRSIDIVVVRNTGTVERVAKAFTDKQTFRKFYLFLPLPMWKSPRNKSLQTVGRLWFGFGCRNRKTPTLISRF